MPNSGGCLRKGRAVVSAMFDDIDDEEDAMDTAAAVFATGDVTKADAVPTATRRPSSLAKAATTPRLSSGRSRTPPPRLRREGVIAYSTTPHNKDGIDTTFAVTSDQRKSPPESLLPGSIPPSFQRPSTRNSSTATIYDDGLINTPTTVSIATATAAVSYVGNSYIGGAVAGNEPHMTSLSSGLPSLPHTSSHGENAQCRLNRRANDNKLQWLVYEFGPGSLGITFIPQFGCPLMINKVSPDGNGNGKLENKDLIIGIDDVLVWDFDAKGLEAMIKRRGGNDTRTITVLRVDKVPSKSIPKRRIHQISPLLRGFFMYFRSERISGESLKKNVHRMKSIWTKFQSFTDADRKRWKDDHRLAELNHNNLLKSQNGISPKNGGQKRPSNSLDLYVANYKTMAPSAKRQTIIRDWNKLSNRSVWDNLVDERRQMSLKYYEDDEDEPTEVAAAATLPSLSAVPATAPNDTVGESSKALWDLQMILKPHLINRPNAKKCDEDECTLVACVKWTSDHKSNKPWFGCLDCQERVFGRWPKDLPVKYLDNKWRDAVCEKCTKKDNPVMPIGRGADRNKSKLSKEQMQKVWHAESDKSNDNDYDSEGDYVPNVEESVPGDTNPEYVNGFVDIKGRARKLSGRMTHKLQEDLCGCHVLYMLYDTKDPSKMKIGFSLNLESRLYTLQYDFITSGNAKVRYVKLTSAISPIKIENYILFVAYFRGYKTGLRREFVRFSEDIASELVSIICSINKFHSHSVTFEGSSKPYWIKAGWCTGAPYNGGGSTGKGIHNMFTHPRIAEYYENKRIGDYCDEPMIS